MIIQKVLINQVEIVEVMEVQYQRIVIPLVIHIMIMVYVHQKVIVSMITMLKIKDHILIIMILAENILLVYILKK